MAVPALQIQIEDTAPMTPKQISIVEAAAKLFLDRGYGSVSMDAIAAEANVSKRTVYSYYENKQTLFADVMRMVCEQQSGMDSCPLGRGDDNGSIGGREMLSRTAEHVLKIILSPLGLEMFRVVGAESGRFPELGQTFHENGPGWIREELAKYFERLNEEGRAKIANPLRASCQFLGAAIMPLKMDLILGVRDHVDEEEIQEVIKSTVDMFVKAYDLTD